MNTQVGANLFASTSLIGLGLNGNGINLGLNELQANRWEGTFTTLAAQHTGSDPQFSAFLVNDNPALPCGDPDYWPNSAGTPSVTPSWFKHVPGCPHACGIQPLVGGGDNSLDNLDLAIINGTYAQTGQSPVSIWNSRYTEYQKIANNPSVFGSNEQANAYLNSLQGMPIAQFYGIEQLVGQGMNYSTTIRNALGGLYTQSIIQHDQVATAHEAYLNDLGNESLKANYFGAVATDNQLHTSIAYYLAQGEQEKTTKLNQAEALNNQVVPANDFETSLRDVNTLRLKRYKGLSYTDLEASNLERIAMKCYEEAGPAVYYARAMLAFIDTTVYNFPTDECSQQRSNPNANGENTISQLNFYPNPVSYDLMISGLSDMKEPAICRVFDMFGRQIMQHTLNGDGSLPFSAVEPGSYVLQVLTEGGQFLSSHKIIKFNN